MCCLGLTALNETSPATSFSLTNIPRWQGKLLQNLLATAYLQLRVFWRVTSVLCSRGKRFLEEFEGREPELRGDYSSAWRCLGMDQAALQAMSSLCRERVHSEAGLRAVNVS